MSIFSLGLLHKISSTINKLVNNHIAVLQDTVISAGDNKSGIVEVNKTTVAISVDWGVNNISDYSLELTFWDDNGKVISTQSITPSDYIDNFTPAVHSFPIELLHTRLSVNVIRPTGSDDITIDGVTISEISAVPVSRNITSIKENIERQKSYAQERYDKVLDIVGLDRLKVFLPMDEGEGTTLTDIIDTDIKFDIKGSAAKWKKDSVDSYINFGNNVSIDSYIVERPMAKNEEGGNWSAYSEKYATKLENIDKRTVNKCALKLKKVGSPAGKLHVTMVVGSSAPTSATAYWYNQQPRTTTEKFTIDCDDVSVDGGWYGFAFDTPLIMDQPPRKYWLVLEYEDDTGVDASNYISWEYEDTNSYSDGGARATYDGETWTVVSEENHAFRLYESNLRFRDNFTIIMTLWNYKTIWNHHLFRVNAMNENYLMVNHRANGMMEVREGTEYANKPEGFYYRGQKSVMALTFNMHTAFGKIKVYQNGKLVTQQRQRYKEYTKKGYGGVGMSRQSTPWHFGCRLTNSAHLINPTNHFRGGLGGLIMCEDELTSTEIQQITNIIRSK